MRKFIELVAKNYNPDNEIRSDWHIKERIRMYLFYAQQLYNMQPENKIYYLTRLLVVFIELCMYFNVDVAYLMDNYIKTHTESEQNDN